MTETVITVTNGAQQTQSRPAADLGWIQFNVNYFLTYPGIIKLIQLVKIWGNTKNDQVCFGCFKLNNLFNY